MYGGRWLMTATRIVPVLLICSHIGEGAACRARVARMPPVAARAAAPRSRVRFVVAESIPRSPALLFCVWILAIVRIEGIVLKIDPFAGEIWLAPLAKGTWTFACITMEHQVHIAQDLPLQPLHR